MLYSALINNLFYCIYDLMIGATVVLTVDSAPRTISAVYLKRELGADVSGACFAASVGAA